MGTHAELYKQDFFAWTQTTAVLIRAGTWYDIAPEALAEEVESLGARDHRELRRRLQHLVTHLLKWQYQPPGTKPGTVGAQQSARNGRRLLTCSSKVPPTAYRVECLAGSLYAVARTRQRPNTPVSGYLPRDLPMDARAGARSRLLAIGIV